MKKRRSCICASTGLGHLDSPFGRCPGDAVDWLETKSTSANTKGNDPMVVLCQGVRGAEKRSSANTEQEKQRQSKAPNVQGEPVSGAGVSTKKSTSANTKYNDPMVGLCQGVRGA